MCRAVLLLMVTGQCAESCCCCCWLLETVPADCAEHYCYDWGLETVQITPMVTGDLCRALLLLLVTRLCRAVLLLMVTGDCAESCWLLETVTPYDSRGRESRGRGAQEGRTYSQRTQLEARHQGHRGTPVSLTLFWICESAGGGERASEA